MNEIDADANPVATELNSTSQIITDNENNIEFDQKKPIEVFLGEINDVSKKIEHEFGVSGPEAILETDKFLVDAAEHSGAVKDFDTALVQGAREAVGEISSSGPNPIDTIEDDGYSKSVNDAVIDLNSKDVLLPSGENVSEVVIEHILSKEDQYQEYIIESMKKLESQKFCFETPILEAQIKEDGRKNEIVYIRNSKEGLKLGSSSVKFEAKDQIAISEHDAIGALRDFLCEIYKDKDLTEYSREEAKDILDNITWIGEKEYNEAVSVIAEYWKEKLRKNPNIVIFPVVGKIAEIYPEYRFDRNRIKSDGWLLDHILSKFTDDEVIEFNNRLILDQKDIPKGLPASDLQIVLLDDWAISGDQLSKVYTTLVKEMPQYKSSMEIQLIAAKESRLNNGLRCRFNNGSKDMVPLRACFKAKDTQSDYGSRISGFYSAVDYDFENSIQRLVENYNEVHEESISMPPTTNIVRPYRAVGYELAEIKRVKVLKSTKKKVG
ncbi:MAG: hypothetical protein WCQ49_02090 [Candidatus Saccharibacteria bacterium]